MNYKTTVFLSIALGAVLLIAAIAGMRYMNPAPEGYRSSFETAKEQTTPQPTQTATPKPTEEPFTGFYDTEAMTLKERIHTPEVSIGKKWKPTVLQRLWKTMHCIKMEKKSSYMIRH